MIDLLIYNDSSVNGELKYDKTSQTFNILQEDSTPLNNCNNKSDIARYEQINSQRSFI